MAKQSVGASIASLLVLGHPLARGSSSTYSWEIETGVRTRLRRGADRMRGFLTVSSSGNGGVAALQQTCAGKFARARSRHHLNVASSRQAIGWMTCSGDLGLRLRTCFGGSKETLCLAAMHCRTVSSRSCK
jgi:hypothetical protein